MGIGYRSDQVHKRKHSRMFNNKIFIFIRLGKDREKKLPQNVCDSTVDESMVLALEEQKEKEICTGSLSAFLAGVVCVLMGRAC